MKLIELEPQFLKRIDDSYEQYVDTIVEADGIQFLCPVCFIKNSGGVGTHSIVCWKPSVPQTTYPRPGRWKQFDFGNDRL
jgi:hypothetical protein